MSKPIEKRLEALEKRSGVGDDNYVLRLNMCRPGTVQLPGGGVESIYWLMRPTPDGKGEVIRTLTPEEAEAQGELNGV